MPFSIEPILSSPLPFHRPGPASGAGQDQRGLLRDEEVGVFLHSDYTSMKLFYLCLKDKRIQHNAVADDVLRFFAKDAGRDLMQYMFDAVELHVARRWSLLEILPLHRTGAPIRPRSFPLPSSPH